MIVLQPVGVDVNHEAADVLMVSLAKVKAVWATDVNQESAMHKIVLG